MSEDTPQQDDSNKSIIEQLPEELLEKFFSYLTFENISNIRRVCHRFDSVCQKMLNQGFSRADRFHAQCQKEIKSRLPRRESERRQHALARHSEILSAIETRLSLLGMTYMKYIDTGLCCFIPGKVLDEMFSVLHLIRDEAKNNAKPPRAHEILQELRDISSMAMEHFDEKVVPILKQKMTPSKVETFINDALENTPGPSYTPQASYPSPATLSFSLPTPTGAYRLPPIRQDVHKVQTQLRSCGTSMIALRKELSDSKSKLIDHKKRISDHETKIAHLTKKSNKQAKKITEQDQKINELNRKIIEYDSKFADIVAQVSSLGGQKISKDRNVPSFDSSPKAGTVKRKRKRRSDEAIELELRTKSRRR